MPPEEERQWQMKPIIFAFGAEGKRIGFVRFFSVCCTNIVFFKFTYVIFLTDCRGIFMQTVAKC